MDFRDKRVTVMGLGTFGGQIAAIQFLAGQGAREIIVTDSKPADQLEEGLRQIAGVPNVTCRLGGHQPGDFVGVDAVVVSPAVPKDHPMLAAARAAAVPLTSEMNLFFQRCRAPIVGITGSAGKSTTTAMIAAVLGAGMPNAKCQMPNENAKGKKQDEHAWGDANLGGGLPHLAFGIQHSTFVGGNIGHQALLPRVDQIQPDHTVVLELSSFQLEDLGELKRSPHVAVVTNIAPNHLDRHGTMAEYVRCKQNILRFQGRDDVVILNGEDPALANWAAIAPGQVLWYRAQDAAGLELKVVGRHNRLNAAAALAVGRVFGLPEQTIAAALAEFVALPHRLELVGQAAGVRYFNDSKATTPESTLTAMDAFADDGSPVIIIVGGYDKHVDLGPLCAQLAARAKAVLAIGQTGPTFVELVGRHSMRAGPPSGPETGATGAPADYADSTDRYKKNKSAKSVKSVGNPAGQAHNCAVHLAGDLETAVRLAGRLAQPGDVVLLSPASASYGCFKNYEERGEKFRELVARSISR